jgi:hypothetical protein
MPDGSFRTRLNRALKRANEQRDANRAAKERQRSEEPNAAHILAILFSKKRPYVRFSRGPRRESDDPESEHRENERSVRRSTVAIGRLTYVLAAAAVIGAVFSWKTYVAIDGQLAEMQDDQRPWVKIKTLEMGSDLVFDDKGIHFILKYQLENVGRSVAINSVFYTIIKQDWYNSIHQAVQNDPAGVTPGPRNWNKDSIIGQYGMEKQAIDICYELFHVNMERQTREPAYIGNINTIFPNDIIRQEIFVSNNEDGTDGFGIKDAKGKFYNIFMIACARYTETGTGAVRYSSYSYSLTGIDPHNSGGDAYLSSERSLIPISELQFEEVTQHGE